MKIQIKLLILTLFLSFFARLDLQAKKDFIVTVSEDPYQFVYGYITFCSNSLKKGKKSGNEKIKEELINSNVAASQCVFANGNYVSGGNRMSVVGAYDDSDNDDYYLYGYKLRNNDVAFNLKEQQASLKSSFDSSILAIAGLGVLPTYEPTQEIESFFLSYLPQNFSMGDIREKKLKANTSITIEAPTIVVIRAVKSKEMFCGRNTYNLGICNRYMDRDVASLNKIHSSEGERFISTRVKVSKSTGRDGNSSYDLSFGGKVFNSNNRSIIGELTFTNDENEMREFEKFPRKLVQ